MLQRGGGPDLAFRAYLLTAVRRLHVDRVRRTSRVHTTDDLTPFDPGVPFRDTAVEGFESAAAARAFASLPERWQLVLWHTEVEGQKPAEVAPLLGMSANSVSALAYRAREGLRQAFLTMHADVPDDDTCAWVAPAPRRLRPRRRSPAATPTRVEDHLERVPAVRRDLPRADRGQLPPVRPAGTGAARVGAPRRTSPPPRPARSPRGGAVVALLDRAKDVVAAHAVTSSVAGAAATAVIGGAVAGDGPPRRRTRSGGRPAGPGRPGAAPRLPTRATSPTAPLLRVPGRASRASPLPTLRSAPAARSVPDVPGPVRSPLTRDPGPIRRRPWPSREDADPDRPRRAGARRPSGTTSPCRPPRAGRAAAPPGSPSP